MRTSQAEEPGFRTGRELEEENGNLRRMLWLLAHSAGGEIAVEEIAFAAFDPARSQIRTFLNARGEWVIQARKIE
jgi:hypothetical protein